MRRLLCSAALVCLLSGTAGAVEPVAFSSDLSAGYARIMLDWAAESPCSAFISNGVLIAKFTRPFTIDTEAMGRELSEYITLARMDPDGLTLRLALRKPFKLHVSADGPRVAFDLLPDSFKGEPVDVVAPATPAAGAPKQVAKATPAAPSSGETEEADPSTLPRLPVRIGEHSAYSRIVFDFPEMVDYSFEVGDDTLSIAFDKQMTPGMTRLESDPPPWVRSASWRLADGKLYVDLKIDPSAGLHHFRDGTKVAFDIKRPTEDSDRVVTPAPQPTAPAESGAIIPKETAAAQPPLPPPPPGSDGAVANAQGAAEHAPAPAATPAPPPAAPVAAHETAAAAPHVEETATTAPAHETKPPAEAAHAPPSEPAATTAATAAAEAVLAELPEPIDPEDLPEPPNVERPKLTASAAPDGADHPPVASDGHASDAAAVADGATGPTLEPLKIAATPTANGVELVFPLTAPTPAAIFPRGNQVWIVFATPATFNLAEVDRRFFSTIAGVEQNIKSAHTVVRITLAEATLVSAVQSGNAWTVALSQSIATPPEAITFTPQPRTVGPAGIRVTLPHASQAVWLDDPDAGDSIAVVPALGPSHGLVTPRRFVEFTAMASAQGLAVLSLVDGLKVVQEGDDVLISSDRGLTLSAGSVPERQVRQPTAASVQAPGYMDFLNWLGEGETFVADRQKLLMAQAPLDADLTKARFALARFFVANELYPEAIGALRLLGQEDASAALDPAFKALRGISNLMMNRLDEARTDLTDNTLIEDAHAALWRSLLFTKLKDWSAARRNFALGEDEVGRYPPKWQGRLRLAAADAALAVNDIQGLDRQLSQMPPDGLESKQLLEALLLRGRMLERIGRNADALAAYKQVADSDDRQMSVRGRFAEVDLRSRSGSMPPAEAIAELDKLRFQWRGDELELGILRRLAELQIAEGDYRNGLNVMRAAVANFPKEPLARKMGEEMVTRFEELFVGGKADALPPVQALGLYYDFKDLTPIGRLGDDMIRKLADRLISVDLLTQATELLQYQVDNRLDGVAKASVATRLAVVYLLDRKPEKALSAIRSSRQTMLPPELARERRLLEARALSEVKQFEAALDMIDGIEDAEAQTLAADIYWSARNWPAAATKLEAVLGDSWQGDKPLDEAQRFNVMRAAVAYSLADDAGGIGRLRVKFAPKMATSPDARGFDVVTEEISRQGVDFRELARDVASVDTLEAFMAGFRERYGLAQKVAEATPPPPSN